jgi:hypothetical protein
MGASTSRTMATRCRAVKKPARGGLELEIGHPDDGRDDESAGKVDQNGASSLVRERRERTGTLRLLPFRSVVTACPFCPWGGLGAGEGRGNGGNGQPGVIGAAR